MTRDQIDEGLRYARALRELPIDPGFVALSAAEFLLELVASELPPPDVPDLECERRKSRGGALSLR